MKFFVIGDSDTVLGFSLTGIGGQVVETPEEDWENIMNRSRPKKVQSLLELIEQAKKAKMETG